MRPPETTNVLDRHNGFTCVSPCRNYWTGKAAMKQADLQVMGAKAYMWGSNTLWRPGSLLKGKTQGSLVAYDESSFYQNNNDVTVALYKVKGYGRLIACWFDNQTGERIA